METLTYQFTLLSDTFVHGAYQTQDFNQPELRAPSVKGMIRWWHEALGYSKADADHIFGKVKGGNKASLVIVRVEPIEPPDISESPFLPHKSRKPKFAITPGTFFRLSLIPRREGLSGSFKEQLKQATEAWLLLGSIGQRSNRAAGSVLWEKCPTTQKDFEIIVGDLTKGSRVSFAILDRVFENDIEARDLAGRFPKHAPKDWKNPSTVPGAVFGSASPRKPSSLKLKVVDLDQAYRLLALWIPSDSQDNPANLEAAIKMMKTFEGKAELGRLLQSALPQLTA
ncbi:RAMP superfamily CRISPR-associated protein [Roseibacillus ishigakijimensis]|uniref:CRISPR type III-associated protein domain-containing protein n=1 Tax=Roseibacillus ishigakijimensis TaxID=454146 RepID=A0A934RKZ0_9BACT|nr:RAMP superfamily CRISPR-associated protein [Roseibacillus ishigakijimensis]MBK1832763.1 hypothetical protein [Roseibacillus ishigakijimensis]